MMYSSAELKAQARESEQEEGRNQPNTPGDGPESEEDYLFLFLFLALISKLMVDILMGGNTQMYYLNGRIDYNEIVTRLGSRLSSLQAHGEKITLGEDGDCIPDGQ